MYREIPSTAIKVEEGKWWNRYSKIIAGKELWFGEIYAEPGYCFYNLEQPENYDEDGNLKDKFELTYLHYMTCICETAEMVNAHTVSVKQEVGFNVA